MKLIRKLKFLITNDSRRLRSARLRRKGLYDEALSEIIGLQNKCIIMFDLMKAGYSPEFRYKIYGAMARKFSAKGIK